MIDRPWEREGLTEDEYKKIITILERKPNQTELGMYGVMWSEHCSYKNSKKVLKRFPTKGEYVLQGPGENAGIIDIGDKLAISFKIESHNHPSAIEPYQGAATGVGGIIRDIFTMGARPIASLNSLRFGELNDEHVRYLLAGVVKGIAGYGNSIGIPTVGGEIYFSAAYKGNPLVNVMCVGLMHHDDIATGTASEIGNPVMVIGATTGRDGIQGASFASEELDEQSEEDRPAVQVGDPFMEKLLLEATLELIKGDLIVGIQDMGAAGLISSSAEMASRGKTGIELNIDLVPKREKGMTPYEVLLSESQERMLLVPKMGKADLVKKIFTKWGLQAAVIGKVTDDGLIRVLDKGEVVAEVPARSLADDAPLYIRETKRPSYLDEVKNYDLSKLSHPTNYEEILLKLLASINIASKQWIYQQYDHMVQTNTVVSPGSDAAVLRIKGTNKGIALTVDCNGRYCYLNPERGGEIAVAEAARNIVCSGAEPLAITDGLNFGNPLNPENYWQFEKCVAGISRACQIFNTPVTGGNVSFYNESPQGAIYPTPVIGMVGLLTDINKAAKHSFQDVGDFILLLGETKEELGGSEYLRVVHQLEVGNIPQLDLELEKRVQAACLELLKKGLVKSAHDCSEGGLAVTIAESCIAGDVGADINISTGLSPEVFLFSESQSRIVVTVSKENLKEAEEMITSFTIPYEVLGKVIEQRLVVQDLLDLTVEELREVWQNSIRSQMEA